jgi:Ca2+-transporting ATPase
MVANVVKNAIYHWDVLVKLIQFIRSRSRLSIKVLLSPNPALWWVIGGGLGFLALILYVPFLRQLFCFSYLHPINLTICLAGGVISLLWFESLKLMNKTANQKR